jgi:signal transduction histidine kinase/CheY-like chemotaxis protein/HPt (histidine-containing phosphotransfer) domain-containing protein
MVDGGISKSDVAFQNQEREKRAAELVLANKELAYQNEEKEKRAAELVVANAELGFQNEEKEKRAAELAAANRELVVQNSEKEKRAAELAVANAELAFQNEEKEKRAAELVIANTELAFQNQEKEKRAAELAVANRELVVQNDEKEERAAELVIANTELAFQNEEKEKRAAELSIANTELAFQNREKEKRAAELVIANNELVVQNNEKEERAAALVIANRELLIQNDEKERRAAELIIANAELAFQSEEKEKRAAELAVANRELVVQNVATHKAKQANRAKSQFLANMSHEIRTPLNAVIGLSYLLERSPLNADQAELVGKMKLAGKGLLAIVNDVLDLSKIEAAELKLEHAPFHLGMVLEDLVDLMTVQSEAKGVVFVSDAPTDLPESLVGDPTRLSQILTNLVTNAIKFTAAGSVRLYVRAVSMVDDVVRLRFSVEDTGVGIAAESIGQLFSPFVQADSSTTRRFGGTGLGLSIVKQLAGLMGGQVGVSSTLGRGSVFWAELPFLVCAVSATSVRASRNLVPVSPLQPTLPGVRVLVADDSPINLEVAQRVLELEGARVTLVANGQEAVDWLVREPQGFDVVLMDIQMPVLDGYDATRRIRAGLGLTTLPIIALTAGTLSSEHREAMAAGANDFVGKPFDPRALVACILRNMRGAPHARDEQPAQQRSLVPPAGTSFRVPPAEPSAAPKPPVLALSWGLRPPTPAVAPATAPGTAGLPLAYLGTSFRPAVLVRSSWPEIRGIESRDVRARLGGDTALFRSMIGRLVRDSGDVKYEENGGAAGLDRLAARLHSVRGTAATLGASSIAQLAAAGESACRARQADHAAEAALKVGEALQQLASDAASLLAERGSDMDHVDEGEGAALDPADLEGLLTLLRESNLGALNRFIALEPTLRRRLGTDSCAAVREQIDTLRFREAATVLGKLQLA